MKLLPHEPNLELLEKVPLEISNRTCNPEIQTELTKDFLSTKGTNKMQQILNLSCDSFDLFKNIHFFGWF